jgi:hypothetical protein
MHAWRGGSKENSWLQKEIGEYYSESCHLISFSNFHWLQGNLSAVLHMPLLMSCWRERRLGGG